MFRQILGCLLALAGFFLIAVFFADLAELIAIPYYCSSLQGLIRCYDSAKSPYTSQSLTDRRLISTEQLHFLKTPQMGLISLYPRYLKSAI